MFIDFDTTPLAAASLGQVRKSFLDPPARLRSLWPLLLLPPVDASHFFLFPPPAASSRAAHRPQVHRATISPSMLANMSSARPTAVASAPRRPAKPPPASPTSPASFAGVAVAVKVQREGLRSIYDRDLGLLGRMVGLLDRLDFRAGGAQQKWGDLFTEACEVRAAPAVAPVPCSCRRLCRRLCRRSCSPRVVGPGWAASAGAESCA